MRLDTWLGTIAAIMTGERLDRNGRNDGQRLV